jgi:putative transposase
MSAASSSEAGERRGKLPTLISVDNGTELTSRAIDHWAYWDRGRLNFIRPGKPTNNAYIEAFNGSLRRECLSQHRFVDLDDARKILSRWREDYNNNRPHSSLGHLPPVHFRAGGAFTPTPGRLENLPA